MSKKAANAWVPDDGNELVELLQSRAAGVSKTSKYQKRFMDVLVAAANQFAKFGYSNASLNDVADEIGVQQGALYYYIKSKEQALELVCEVAINGYVEFSEQIISTKESAVRKIERVVHEHLLMLEQRPSFFKVFQTNRRELSDKARRKIGLRVRKYEENVRKIVADGIVSGEFRSDVDPNTAMLLILAMCNSVVIWNEKRGEMPLDNITREISAMFTNGVIKK